MKPSGKHRDPKGMLLAITCELFIFVSLMSFPYVLESTAKISEDTLRILGGIWWLAFVLNVFYFRLAERLYDWAHKDCTKETCSACHCEKEKIE